jgi:tetratricopeptide (TPR) repeat protein
VIGSRKRSIWASFGSPFFLALCLAAILGAPLPGFAHGDMHGQILEISQQIEKEPANPDLYLKRGELHRYHQDWDAAQADYDRALALNPKLEIIDFVRGRMYFEANWLLSARVALDRFLTKQPNHADALITRARTLTKLERRLDGAKDYTRAIALSTESRPELYFERAQALAGEGAPHVKEAIEGLDEGIKKLGPLVTLQLCAIDIEVQHKKYDAAVARLDQVIAKAPRKETWLARKGEVLSLAGKKEEARQAFKAALQSLETLPPGRRNVPAMLDLQKHLQEEVDKSGS